ncbi:unnamed protein product [Urochloa humidicola]
MEKSATAGWTWTCCAAASPVLPEEHFVWEILLVRPRSAAPGAASPPPTTSFSHTTCTSRCSRSFRSATTLEAPMVPFPSTSATQRHGSGSHCQEQLEELLRDSTLTAPPVSTTSCTGSG